jgi:hypothetical protein
MTKGTRTRLEQLVRSAGIRLDDVIITGTRQQIRMLVMVMPWI